MKEKIIKGYENYVVLSDGRVKNITTGYYLKPIVRKTGYCDVRLVDKNHKCRDFLLHRLVAKAFCENPQNKSEVNHIDGNKLNNNCTNLEWVSRNENLKHAFEVGLTPYNTVAKKVIATNIKTGEKFCFDSIHIASKQLGISQGNICMACKKQRPHASGYYWNYA